MTRLKLALFTFKPMFFIFALTSMFLVVSLRSIGTGSFEALTKQKNVGFDEIVLERQKSKVDLFELHKANTFKQTGPQVCVAFLACSRPHLLKRSITALVQYMHTKEPNITYEIMLWDNGSGLEAIKGFLTELPIDIFIMARLNVGIAKPLDHLYFDHCRAPYILGLEEDWEANLKLGAPFIQMSMNILENDQQVSEVWLRYDEETYDKKESEWLLTPVNSKLNQYLPDGQVMYHRQFAVSGWGSYTNGASLKNRKKLQEEVGRLQPPNDDSNGEWWYQGRVREKNLASAHICWNQSPINRCDKLSHDEHRQLDKDYQPFLHIGTEARSPGHNTGVNS